jgi:hypothetical protein
MSINTDDVVWPIDFSCTLVIENIILPNHYNIRVSIEPNGEAQSNIATGFKKIRYFVENHLHNSVFINRDNALVQSLVTLDTNIVHLPTDPYDFFVGSILLRKFIVLTEKYFDICQINIDSLVGDSIQYAIMDPEDAELEMAGDHWWNADSADTGSSNTKSWAELDISDRTGFEPRVIRGGLSEN